MSPYSNAWDLKCDDNGIYTDIPFEHSAEVIQSYDRAFKNQNEYDNPSIYAEVSENFYNKPNDPLF